MILTVARYDLDKLSDNSYSLDEEFICHCIDNMDNSYS